ncbi:hypothetical protein Ancab_038514 [Ancistrocladus abbreviatus]
MARDNNMVEASIEKSMKKKSKKKRREPEPDVAIGFGKDTNGIQIDDNEPTIGEKLASINLVKESDEIQDRQGPSPAQLPSADSVHVLLKQALHADDRALLLDCLYNQDEKVLLCFLFCYLMGAVVVCALPWLRSLLLQHASRIVSHESSLVVLNSLYQLIESRVSSFSPALQLASNLDFLFAGITDDGVGEFDTITPVIYEDKDESEEEGSEDAMETDQENEEREDSSGVSDN